MSGQFYGLTFLGGDLLAFQAFPALNRGRIIRITDGNVKIINDRMDAGCHQIDVFEDHIYVTDTYGNSVIKLDNQGSQVERYFPFGTLSSGRGSSNYVHLNSIFFTEDSVCLMCHNETSKTGRKSKIVVLDRDFSSLLSEIEVGENAHNVVVRGGVFNWCNSGAGLLSSSVGKNVSFDNFTRGLSVTDRYVVVGESEYAKRQHRTRVGGWLNFFDHEMRLLQRDYIPGMVQEIRSLRDLDYGLSAVREKRNFVKEG